MIQLSSNFIMWSLYWTACKISPMNLLLFLFALRWSLAVQLKAPTVSTSHGWLRGKHFTTRNGRTVFGFLGIPFAKPPVGCLRFRSPEPPEPWMGIRDATTDGEQCTQTNILNYRARNVTIGSEDCLYLNVYTPVISNKAKLPVMMFIHGGGFFGDSSTSQLYGPDFLLDKDVVLVVPNYRLGPLGFLSAEDDFLPGNYGMKDQTEALKWIQSNINAFGGNKDSVTIFGNSAGGGSVHLHTYSPLSKGLFHAAISQSGTALCQWVTHPPGSYRKLAFRVAKEFGCPTYNTQYLADCLRVVPANDISSLTYKYLEFDLDPTIMFPPAIERNHYGAFLTRDPWTSTSSVPWMVGMVSEEGCIRTAPLIHGKAEAKVAKLNALYKRLLPASIMVELTAKDPVDIANRVKKYYFGNGDISLNALPQIIKMYTDSWFTYCTSEAVGRQKGPVYNYYISFRRTKTLAQLFGQNINGLGTCHLDELLYLFPMNLLLPNRTDTEHEKVFSQNLVEMWTNFARYRDPTPKPNTFIKWNQVTTSNKEYLHMKDNGYAMEANLLKERFDFWKDLPFREKPEPSD